ACSPCSMSTPTSSCTPMVSATWPQDDRHLLTCDSSTTSSATTRVLEYAERMVGMGKGRNGADPFVIALAVARDGVVVTEEYRGSLASPKIPVVCEALA